MVNQMAIRKSYFYWLKNLVDHKGSDREDLISWLHEKNFRWFLPNDDNREKDGIDLREEFSRMSNRREFNQYLNGPCTMLEMLIALAKRLNYTLYDPLYGDELDRWFWSMVENLGLSFDLRGEGLRKNEMILDRLLDRTYLYNGRGGLFPLMSSRGDQRTVEIWYQMQYWIKENGF